MEVVSRKGGENLNGGEEEGSEETSGEGWKEDGKRVLASISGVRGIDEERR